MTERFDTEIEHVHELVRIYNDLLNVELRYARVFGNAEEQIAKFLFKNKIFSRGCFSEEEQITFWNIDLSAHKKVSYLVTLLKSIGEVEAKCERYARPDLGDPVGGPIMTVASKLNSKKVAKINKKLEYLRQVNDAYEESGISD